MRGMVGYSTSPAEGNTGKKSPAYSLEPPTRNLLNSYIERPIRNQKYIPTIRVCFGNILHKIQKLTPRKYICIFKSVLIRKKKPK